MRALTGALGLTLLLGHAPALAQTVPSLEVFMTLDPGQSAAALDEVVLLQARTVDAGGLPVAGVAVGFDVLEGPGQGQTETVLTDVDGIASFSFSGVGEVGTSLVRATKLHREAELIDVDLEEFATVEWTCSLHQAQFGEAVGVGFSVPSVQLASCFYLGQTAMVEVSGTKTMTPGVLAIGVEMDAAPLAGGLLYLEPLVLQAVFLGPDGTAAGFLEVPNAPALAGLDVFFQFANPDDQAIGGLAMSAGLHAIIDA